MKLKAKTLQPLIMDGPSTTCTANVVIKHPATKTVFQDTSRRLAAGASSHSPTTKTSIFQDNEEEVGFCNPPITNTLFHDFNKRVDAVSSIPSSTRRIFQNTIGTGELEPSTNPPHPTTRTIFSDINKQREETGPSTTSPCASSDMSNLLESGMGQPKTHGIYTPRRHLSNWSAAEDDLLRQAVAEHKARNWKLIAAHLPNRTDVQCLHRWQKVLNPVLVKGYWTKEEDERMIELVNMFGTKRWAAIARSLPGRNGKQCRERWCNHLDPTIKKDPWTEVEDLMLFLAHEKFGNRWAEISKLLPGRSDNAVKNRWNTSVKKKAKDLQNYCTLWSLQNASPEGLPPQANRPSEEEMSTDEFPDEYPDENLLISEVNDYHDPSTFDLFEIDISKFSPPSSG